VPAEEVFAYLSLAGLKGSQGEMSAWMVFTREEEKGVSMETKCRG